MRKIVLIAILLMTSTEVFAQGPSDEAGDIGTVFATMNRAILHRAGGVMGVMLGAGVRVGDAFETTPQSRVKFVLRDGSAVTLDQVSKMSVEKFGGISGTSGFRLFGGFMRVVSEGAGFEIRTDEAVITAEKGAIEVVAGVEEGRLFTAIACLEGTASVRGVESAGGTVKISKNQIVTVMRGEPMMKPLSLPSSGIRVMNSSEITEFGVRLMVEDIESEISTVLGPSTDLSPINQQPSATTPVRVRIGFQ